MALKAPPFLNIPAGKVAQVRIIDTGATIASIPTERLMAPKLVGFGHIPEMPSLSFLVESSTGRRVLFDLGISKDWPNFAPIVSNRLKTNGYEIKVEVDVAETLTQHGVDLASIESIVWSHWHWDHIGNPSTFPPATEIVVGPGFKKAFLPTYPAGRDSPVRTTDFRGRNVREMNFDDGIQLGRFKAIDFFGDGSFYILNTPGHAIGHLGALARTTSDPDTFIFMGGDLCHHSSEMRPSEYLHLPTTLTHTIGSRALYPCPGAVLEKLQLPRQRSDHEPLFDPARGVPVEVAVDTVIKAQEFDANQDILFVYAHEKSVTEVGDLFPLTANDWKAKGWREQMMWAFLRDFKHLVE